MGTLKLSIYCLPFGVLIIGLGFIGLTATTIYVQRFDDHRNRARAFRGEIDKLVTPTGKAESILDANRMDKTDRLRSFWEKINRGVIALGAICLLCNLLAIWERMNIEPSSASFVQKILDQLSL